MAAAIDPAAILQAKRDRAAAVAVSRSVPATIDLVLLAVSDHEGPPEAAYNAATDDKARDDVITAHAREGVQLLLNAVFNRPTTIIDEGVIAQLPTAAQQDASTNFTLPRSKPLPKPRPETKWERFAKEKGIQPKEKKDRLVLDEEKQEWVPRYGYKGKNKDAEDQWLVEIPNDQDPLFDPRAAAKAERKARSLKNESQRIRNAEKAVAKSLPQAGPSNAARQAELTRDLKTTRKSTASLGKFDSLGRGEKETMGRQRREKRQFESNDLSAAEERQRGLATLDALDRKPASAKRARTDPTTADGLVNTRKAIRSVSRGRGASALAGSSRGRGSGRGRGRGR